MSTPSRLAVTALLLAVFPALAAGADLRAKLTLDRTNWRLLPSLFGSYGYQPGECVVVEAESLRLWLPSGVAGVGQTGVYSSFALAGDCEVTVAYELLTVQPPEGGYGSGLGLAFDAGDAVGRCSIQRVDKPGEGAGYVLQSALAAAKGKPKEEYRFVAASAVRGRIGLRRVKKEVVFLASADLDGPLEEVGRQGFTERAVRAVRLFADAGGSPTAVDVRVAEVAVRAEEVAGGEPRLKRGLRRRWWPWVVVPGAGAVMAVGVWLVYRQRAARA